MREAAAVDKPSDESGSGTEAECEGGSPERRPGLGSVKPVPPPPGRKDPEEREAWRRCGGNALLPLPLLPGCGISEKEPADCPGKGSKPPPPLIIGAGEAAAAARLSANAVGYCIGGGGCSRAARPPRALAAARALPSQSSRPGGGAAAAERVGGEDGRAAQPWLSP